MPPFPAKVPASTQTKENEMKNFKTYAIAAILAGAFALPLASANAAGNSGSTTSGTSASAGTGAITSQTFKSLDADRSGTLSKSEFEKYSGTANFDKADANGDGNLTLSEAQTVSSSSGTSGTSGNGYAK